MLIVLDRTDQMVQVEAWNSGMCMLLVAFEVWIGKAYDGQDEVEMLCRAFQIVTLDYFKAFYRSAVDSRRMLLRYFSSMTV